MESDKKFSIGLENRYVCSACLEKKGESADSVAAIFSEMEVPARELHDLDQYPDECPGCGTSLLDMIGDLRAGCSECYITYAGLYEDVDINLLAEGDDGEEDELFSLEFQLAVAVREERYEDANDIKKMMENVK